MGYGLFTSKLIPKITRIITNRGSIISINEYNEKVKSGEESGGYTLYLSHDYVLACYKYAMDGTCLASMANTNRNAIEYESNKRAIANAKIVTTSCEAYIVSLCEIDARSEILVPYGNRYKMH